MTEHKPQEVDRLLAELFSRLQDADQLEPGSAARAAAVTSALLEIIELRRNTVPSAIGQFDRSIAPLSEYWTDFATVLATEAVRRASPHLLKFAVAALLLNRGTSDPRDFVTSIVLVANSADLLHVSPESAINQVDIRECRAQDEHTIRAVFRKPVGERHISSYYYCSESTGSEFRYRKLR